MNEVHKEIFTPCTKTDPPTFNGIMKTVQAGGQLGEDG